MINTTYAKQEVDIIQRILEQADYSERLDNVKLTLPKFEGKHFRHLTSEQLLGRIMEVAIKLKNLKLINHYSILNQNVHQICFVVFDIQNKIPKLVEYKEKIVNAIANEELKIRYKKPKRLELDHDTKSLKFELPNGYPVQVYLRSQLSESDKLYFLVKVLYEYWLKFEGKIIPKSKMIDELNQLGWHDATEEQIKIYIGNFRAKKLRPLGLLSYIDVITDRKLKGYMLQVSYPTTLN